MRTPTGTVRIKRKDITYYLQIKRWWGWKTLLESCNRGDLTMVAQNLKEDAE